MRRLFEESIILGSSLLVALLGLDLVDFSV